MRRVIRIGLAVGSFVLFSLGCRVRMSGLMWLFLYADKSSVMTFMALHILAWLFTCIALVQTALRRPIRQPAVYAFIAAICTTISTSLATTFSTCTLDLIRASLHDKTAQLGPARMLSYAAAALLFLAGMLFWFEFKFVKKLHESIVVVGGGKKKDAHGGHGKDAHGHGKDHGHGGGHGKGHGDHHV
ncbi:uncharacterized protein EV422DRAFT_224479 [Fimicolochytrium jonesii]|uniref:uncharacterized protein n=1 Tax=Fimicolochytrium jonesii TaxID=1396493 RepID=UPI0022FDC88C|nr:uncharacterized protein EV422DRAFT_224479 [Fimicolochytrium jonesii]KAI8817421.1 hypothetical protein EV422DRAFT_224479 [Fimicolochytrium jonesii]